VTDPTRRVQQLLALATDPAASEEEARTAALEAARRIKQHGLQVVSEEEWDRPGPPGYYTSQGHTHPYGTNVTPQGRQMGPGTPRLPPRPSQSRAMAVPRDDGIEPMRGGAHVVDWDFRDDVPGEKSEQAFSPALLALLRK
jgi:Protein of unknown function (DUF2786)